MKQEEEFPQKQIAGLNQEKNTKKEFTFKKQKFIEEETIKNLRVTTNPMICGKISMCL